MSDKILIKAENISKKFCRDLNRSIKYGIQDVARDLVGVDSKPDQLREDEFWAVDNVSFQLNRGETLGIIGPNGSGKTTILKMLNGIFMPDKGKIAIRGKVGALLEIGAGFHPMLSGRENIYINGVILGMSKKEIDKKFDSIVEFADIGDFIDSPVKFYSSGMYVRLGFAIAIHCEPDILLIDEILAVGDRDFQIKCFQKISEVIKNGVCLVLVAHNEYAIVEYTSKSIFLKNGRQMFLGESEKAITAYVNNLLQDSKDKFGKEQEGTPVVSRKNRIVKVTLYNLKMEPIKRIISGDTLIVDFKYEAEEKIENPIFGISFYTQRELITGFFNSYVNIPLPSLKGNGVVRLTVKNFLLPAGVYRCDVCLNDGSIANVLDWQPLGYIVVEKEYGSRGLIKLEQKWKVLS